MHLQGSSSDAALALTDATKLCDLGAGTTMGTFSLQQAAASSPELARVAERVRQSGDMLRAVLPLIPQPMQAHVAAGPVDDTEWCLLVSNVAVASKLRQLVPLLSQRLAQHGWLVRRVRVKVRSS